MNPIFVIGGAICFVTLVIWCVSGMNVYNRACKNNYTNLKKINLLPGKGQFHKCFLFYLAFGPAAWMILIIDFICRTQETAVNTAFENLDDPEV